MAKKPRKTGPAWDLQAIRPIVEDVGTAPEAVLARLSGLGLSEVVAARLVRMDPADFAELLEIRADYRAAWDAGVQLADAGVTNALLVAAIAGDVAAQRFWLVNRLPHLFSVRGGRKGEARPAAEASANPFKDLRIVG